MAPWLERYGHPRESYETMCLVRHPLDRAVSWWKYRARARGAGAAQLDRRPVLRRVRRPAGQRRGAARDVVQLRHRRRGHGDRGPDVPLRAPRRGHGLDVASGSASPRRRSSRPTSPRPARARWTPPPAPGSRSTSPGTWPSTRAPSERPPNYGSVIARTPAEAGPGASRPTMAAMHPGFRQDIQGLRALAVLLVILDHARIGPFHGGFVGVDVFFVISGFLITGLLVSEAERTGRVSLLGFYARRARRILPAATLVIVVTVARQHLLPERGRGQRRDRGRALGDVLRGQLQVRPRRHRLLPERHPALAAPALLVAGGGGAVLRRLAAAGRCCSACTPRGGPGAAPARAASARGSATWASRRWS